jgi:sulfite reductase alpha subunit-like flavoprotein
MAGGRISAEALTSLFVAILASPFVYECVRRQRKQDGAAGSLATAQQDGGCCGAEAGADDGGTCGCAQTADTPQQTSGGCGCGAQKSSESSDGSEGERAQATEQNVTVLHASLTGTAKGFATGLADTITSNTTTLSSFRAVARDLGEYSDSAGADIEDQLQAEQVVVFVLATYEGGVAPGRSAGFVHWLTDFSNDFRVNKKMLAGVRFAVFGCGNSDYDKNFNAVAKAVTNSMLLLGAQQLYKRGDGDDSLNMGTQFIQWQGNVLESLAMSAGVRSSSLATRRASAAGKRHPAVGSRSTRRGKGTENGGTKGEVRLPLKEYRRQKRLAKERAAAERAAAEGYGSSSAEDSGGSGTLILFSFASRFHPCAHCDWLAMQVTKNGWTWRISPE